MHVRRLTLRSGGHHNDEAMGAGASALVRAMVAATGPVTRVELAALVGVSQSRVSQVLGRLALSLAITSTPDGHVGRRGQLIDLYVDNHRPAPVDVEVPWYSLHPMREQVHRLRAHAKSVSTRVVVSADLAPDLLAPWRHPTLTAGITKAEGARRRAHIRALLAGIVG